MPDHPFMQTIQNARDALRDIPGAQVFQKFTCQKCKSRQTLDEPNTFFTHASCQECQHITDIYKSGTNYVLAAGIPSGILPPPAHRGIKLVVSEPYNAKDFPPK